VLPEILLGEAPGKQHEGMMPIEDDHPPEGDASDDDAMFDPSWSRGFNSYGTFRRGKQTEQIDKRLAERGFAENALTGGQFAFSDLRSLDHDPPDCSAIVDGELTGIEVTEFIDEEAIKLTLAARRQSPPGVDVYREWLREPDLFRQRLQLAINRKLARVGAWKGGPYQRRMLVIHTDEGALNPDTVPRLLDGIHFALEDFTDAVMVLRYNPDTGLHPTYRLSTAKE
jgi:hypothetical protein